MSLQQFVLPFFSFIEEYINGSNVKQSPTLRCIVSMKEFGQSESQEGNKFILRSICLEHLKICPVMLSIKREPATPNYLLINKKKRGEL